VSFATDAVRQKSDLEAVLKISGGRKFWGFAKCQSLILPRSYGQYLFCHADFFPKKAVQNIFKTASYFWQSVQESPAAILSETEQQIGV